MTTHWLIAKTLVAHEFHAAAEIDRLTATDLCLVPAIPVKYRTGKSQSRQDKYVAIIPARVFVPENVAEDAEGSRYHLGWLRNAQGGVYRVPGVQIARFNEAVQAWLKTPAKGKGPKAKYSKMDVAALQAKARELFGAEVVEDAYRRNKL